MTSLDDTKIKAFRTIYLDLYDLGSLISFSLGTHKTKTKICKLKESMVHLHI